MTREIHIRPVLNGYIVTVGCQTVVFTSPAVLTAELLRYYNNPDKVAKEYMANPTNQVDSIAQPIAEAAPVEQNRDAGMAVAQQEPARR